MAVIGGEVLLVQGYERGQCNYGTARLLLGQSSPFAVAFGEMVRALNAYYIVRTHCDNHNVFSDSRTVSHSKLTVR